MTSLQQSLEQHERSWREYLKYLVDERFLYWDIHTVRHSSVEYHTADTDVAFLDPDQIPPAETMTFSCHRAELRQVGQTQHLHVDREDILQAIRIQNARGPDFLYDFQPGASSFTERPSWPLTMWKPGELLEYAIKSDLKTPRWIRDAKFQRPWARTQSYPSGFRLKRWHRWRYRRTDLRKWVWQHLTSGFLKITTVGCAAVVPEIRTIFVKDGYGPGSGLWAAEKVLQETEIPWHADKYRCTYCSSHMECLENYHGYYDLVCPRCGRRAQKPKE